MYIIRSKGAFVIMVRVRVLYYYIVTFS